MNINKFFYTLIVLQGMMWGYSCGCKEDVKACSAAKTEYSDQWLKPIINDTIRFASINGSLDTISYYIGDINLESTEQVDCYSQSLGQCVCDDCDASFTANIKDDNSENLGYVKINVTGNEKGDEGNYSLNVNWLGVYLYLRLPESKSSMNNHIFYESIELNNSLYANVYRFFKTKNVDGVVIEIPGHVFYQKELGIIQFEDPNSSIAYTRID